MSGNEGGGVASRLDLYDYRRRVAEMYRERERAIRAGEDGAMVIERFRAAKDRLFAKHPQSALNEEQRARFGGLRYFDYGARFRVEGTMRPVMEAGEGVEAADGPHTIYLRPAARVDFEIGGAALRLVVYWIDVYGGGLFLPFWDRTCPEESYGGGRYLFDTVKGSDFLRVEGESEDLEMGYGGGRVVLDFNYAYNPSCAYDSRWVCPLAPRENRLDVEVRAGERKFE
jgi:uncharacterized protein (DUF1684 family)